MLDICMHNILHSKLTNNVDPDQLASEQPADLDLRCFQNKIYSGLISVNSVLKCFCLFS